MGHGEKAFRFYAIVTDYLDNATGIMIETSIAVAKFTEITLHPIVTILDSSKTEKANELHKKANDFYFIANSLNFPVHHKPTFIAIT